MRIKSNNRSITASCLVASVLIKMDHFCVYLKEKQLVKLKNFLLDSLRTLKKNKKEKEYFGWVKEKHKMAVCVLPFSNEVGITVPLNVKSSGPIGKTNLILYLDLNGVNCFARQIKDALLEIRLAKKQETQDADKR